MRRISSVLCIPCYYGVPWDSHFLKLPAPSPSSHPTFPRLLFCSDPRLGNATAFYLNSLNPFIFHHLNQCPASIINSLTSLSHWPSMDGSINKVTREWWLMRHYRIAKDRRCHYNLDRGLQDMSRYVIEKINVKLYVRVK